MNELFKLLFSNIFIVIAIIGFIFSVIKKAQKGASTTRMPSFGGNTAPNASSSPRYPAQERPGDIVVVERPVITHRPAEMDMGSSSSPSEYVETDYLRELKEKKALAEHKRRQAAAYALPKEQQAAMAEPFRMPQGSELRRAVILAEVLGPPRAKKPHGRS